VITRRTVLLGLGAGAVSACGASTEPRAAKKSCGPLPCKVTGIYWNKNDTYRARLINTPLEFNVVYLFAAKKASPLGVVSYGQERTIDTIRVLRLRGQKVLLSIGGAGQGISFTSREVSKRFLNSVIRINSELGGTVASPAVDGIDFNTFEAEAAPHVEEYLWMTLEAKRRFGDDFAITAPPAPWNPRDAAFCKTMLAEGGLDYIGLQFYDGPGLAEPDRIVQQTSDWIENVAGGDATKVVVGFGMSTLKNYSTIAQIEEAWRAIEKKHPSIRGTYLWQAPGNRGYDRAFADKIIPLVA